MYDLIDQPVQRLDTFERHMLQATRRWVHALVAGGSAAAAGTDGAFGRVMRLIEQHSADEMAVSRPCAPIVAEAEAVLLGLWRLMRDGRESAALATARLITGEAAGALLAAMRPLARA